MAKSVSKKGVDPGSPAAFSSKAGKQSMQSTENTSKYAPGKDVDLNVQSLDPEDGLMKLFVDAIKDLYWAENQLVKALPKMAKAAASPQLSKAILDHQEQTQTHVKRLESIFEMLGKKPQAKKCDAMEGLTKEGEGIIEDTDADTPARDLGIIMASQKVEHYEIASYTGLVNLAVNLNLPDVGDLLSQTLMEEEESDELLATIADNIMSLGENSEREN